MVFSPELILAAMRASNGEYAFTRADTPLAIRELQSAGYAVLGGEVWLASADGPSLIASSSGQFVVYSWSSDDRRDQEEWCAFVDRTTSLALEALEGLRPEEDLIPADGPLVRFNLTYVDELEYGRLTRR